MSVGTAIVASRSITGGSPPRSDVAMVASWSITGGSPLPAGAAIASARRAGTTATLDVLNKYIQYCEMPLVTSNYWPMVHGFSPKDVMEDKEGLQIMHTLGRNMAWLLKCIEAGKKAGVQEPAAEQKVFTNFIR